MTKPAPGNCPSCNRGEWEKGHADDCPHHPKHTPADTPRTNAAEMVGPGPATPLWSIWFVTTETARALERELNEALRQADHWKQQAAKTTTTTPPQ